VSIELEKLKIISAKMGQDISLIQASGGNTSLKLGKDIWVKGSGKRLKDSLKQEIFIRINNFAQYKDNFQNLDSSVLKPSIEAPLHTILPHKVVLHSHPFDVITQTIIVEKQADIKSLLSDFSYDYIPYCRPGKPLAEAIKKSLDKSISEILILENHGLIVGAETVEIADYLQQKVVQLLKIPKRNYKAPNLNLINQVSSQLKGTRLPRAEILHTLSLDPWSLELACKNPAYPDHVVFCGIQPAVFQSITQINQNNVNKEKFLLIPGIGTLLTEKANHSTEEMLEAQAEIFLRIPVNSNVKVLSNQECNELIDWEDEKYRQALAI
tara:strand:+ start:163 stop:1137 length:975 start_codon:yes stop_codon:yes gene_type:complete